MANILKFKEIPDSARREYRGGAAYPDGYEESMAYGVYRGTKKLFSLDVTGTNFKTVEQIKGELAFRARAEIAASERQAEFDGKPIDAPTESEFTIDLDELEPMEAMGGGELEPK